MTLEVTIPTSEIPPDTDPILKLIPLIEVVGYRLVANGVGNGKRFLVFESVDR